MSFLSWAVPARGSYLAGPAMAALLLAGCGGGGEGEAEAQETKTGSGANAEAARAVSVARVETRPIEGGLSVAGVLVAREEAAVGTEIAGYRISRVLVDEGDYVRRGQTLAVLDPTLINADVATTRAQGQRSAAAVAQAQAALAETQVRAAQAQGEADRVRGLDGQGVLSQEAIEARRSAAASARAAVSSAQAAVNAARADVTASNAQLQQVQTRQSRTSVAAPVGGRILERNARPGEISGGGAVPMFRIARDGLIELDAEVPEALLARVRPGDSAQVQLPGGGAVAGNVRYVDPTIDPQTRLGRARIALPPREDLRLGGFARASLSGVSRPAKAVPETAVRFTAEGASVYVVGAQDRRVRRVSVRTGERGNGFVELLDGPPVGAMVILGGSAFVLEGDVVRPRLAAAPASARTTAPAAAPRPAAASTQAQAQPRPPARTSSQTQTRQGGGASQ